MSIIIGRLEFEGPFDDPLDIKEEPGIYGIISEVEDELELVELGETHCLRECLNSDEHVSNIQFLTENCRGKLSAVVHYTPDLLPSERIEIKHQLLSELDCEFDTVSAPPELAGSAKK
jgi:hypothetical protein